jgi:hypothetical protein
MAYIPICSYFVLFSAAHSRSQVYSYSEGKIISRPSGVADHAALQWEVT